jgi:UDP-N-acetylmuramate dehydrogenase
LRPSAGKPGNEYFIHIIKPMSPVAEATFGQVSGLPDVSVLQDAPLARYTRFGIGGPADLFVETANPDSFIQALEIARASGLQTVIVGGGTNLIVSDAGFRGVVLKLINDSIESSCDFVSVEAGTALQDLVDFTVDHGLKGLETMTGIPGSVGGAIYGNAGAYGHSIMERISTVRFFDGKEIREVDSAACEFRYRDSIFKRRKDWIVFSARLLMEPGDAVALRETADRILDTRNRKYPPTMKCAGSIFKNLLLAELPPHVAAAVPPNVIIEGKVPSAWFLEQAGAKGTRIGDIQVATYHANLIYNDGHGTACEVAAIIGELKRRVNAQWGIDLEEEVQYIGCL